MIKILLLIMSTYYFVKSLMQIKSVPFSKFIQLVFHLSLFVWLLLDLLNYKLIGDSFLGVHIGSSLALTALLVINLDPKKNKVFWRLPLITGLVTYHFKGEFIIIAYCVSELMSYFLLMRSRQLYLFAFRQQAKVVALLAIAVASYSVWESNLSIYLSFFLVLPLKNQIINSLNLKLKVSKNL